MLSACEEDVLTKDITLTPEQQELIGTAINFQPYVDNFVTTRKADSPNHEGGFNTGDLMYLYRQYYDEEEGWVYKNPPGTVYMYTDLNNGETGIFERESWKVYENKTFRFYDKEELYNNVESQYFDPYIASNKQKHSYYKRLEKGDSITWESGVTVRFRAWVLSKLANNLADESGAPGQITSVSYPDYMVCDWVTVSGPTEYIPMSMRHLGCRLGFYPVEDNQFTKIEISTDPADYMREDNADTNANDALDKHPAATDPANPEDNTAEWCAANVKDVYERMCWPGGVDMDDLSLMTCKKDEYTGTIKHGTLSEEKIKEKDANGEFVIKHAAFTASVDSRFYMITIPYDMSNNPEKKDKPLVLPPYTRFRVWLRDVNNGDRGEVGSSESDYHIFRLSDVMKRNTNGSSDTSVHPFANGLTMYPGYSFTFYVGYHYNQIKVYAEDSFSWKDEPLDPVTSVDQTANPFDQAAVGEYLSTRDCYGWWKEALTAACNSGYSGQGYAPEFEIENEKELNEFANLVNGNFRTGPAIFKEWVDVLDAEGNVVKNDDGTVRQELKWYTGTHVNGDGSIEKDYVEKEVLEDMGYLFYDSYTRSVPGVPAKIEEDYLKEPYSFFDNQFKLRWTVNLKNDIDLEDRLLTPIGASAHPFCGSFNGNGNCLTNVFMNGETLFGYVQSSNIMNLRLESTHPLSISGTCDNSRILGCSVIAPSTKGTLADATKGVCYFVGCIHVGDSKNVPLVNNSGDSSRQQDLNNLEKQSFKMYGCMQAASGISGAALAKVDVWPKANSGELVPFIFAVPDTVELNKVGWNDVACNYYDMELSKAAKAYQLPLSSYMLSSDFHRLQYIRGAKTHVLCAKDDFLIDNLTKWDKVDPKEEFYGVAPWRAMNFGIWMYNQNSRDEDKCLMHYENTSTLGYSHKYPILKTGEPGVSQYLDVTKQFN